MINKYCQIFFSAVLGHPEERDRDPSFGQKLKFGIFQNSFSSE